MKSKSNNINTMIIVGAWYRNSLAVALSFKKTRNGEYYKNKKADTRKQILPEVYLRDSTRRRRKTQYTNGWLV